MTKKYFKEQTIGELKALKKNATKGELRKLSIRNLRVSDRHNCIYGQMTGHCRSKRAMELIDKGCIKKIQVENQNPYKVNIPPVREGRLVYFSFLEKYIMEHYADNRSIIAWLKGETKTFPIK